MSDTPHKKLQRLSDLAKAATGDAWRLGRDDAGNLCIEILANGGRIATMRVTRDEIAASDPDIYFIAHARDAVNKLAAHFNHQATLTLEDLRNLDQRLINVTPPPWRTVLESDGGHGGDSIITVTDPDNAADIYLWLDPKHLAADADFEFVAAARNDLPEIIAAGLQSIAK